MRIFVVIPTLGRPAVVAETVRFLARQTRKPDGVLVVAVKPADVEGMAQVAEELAQTQIRVDVEFSVKGLCRQRNHALRALNGQADVICMFDDDYFAAPDFLEQAEAYLAANPTVVGLNGKLLADGARGSGLDVEQGRRLIDEREPSANLKDGKLEALYGCNMVLRCSAMDGLAFDENLPLYGWQEDIDFTFQLGRRGRLVKVAKLQGVHLGVRSGKTPGKQLGYSQIANPIYLLRKRTIPRKLAMKLLFKNPVANIVKLVAPEPHIDRVGRLQGNLLALVDMISGRLDPRRIEQLV